MANTLVLLGKIGVGLGLVLYSLGNIVSAYQVGDGRWWPHRILVAGPSQESIKEASEKASKEGKVFSAMQTWQVMPGMVFWILIIAVGLLILWSEVWQPAVELDQGKG